MKKAQGMDDKNIISLVINLYLDKEINALKSRNRYKKASEIGLML